MLKYASLLLLGVLISSVAQVLLKKSALKKYDTLLGEYLNARVIVAYGMFFAATFLSVLAYKVIPLSMGQVLETTGYLYVTLLGIFEFGEKLNRKKVLALLCIILGVALYSCT